MVRFKFLLFALFAIALWTAHLFLVSPVVAERAVADAQSRAGTASGTLGQQVLQRRSDLERLALKVSGLGVSAQLNQLGRVAPTAERLNALAAALKDVAPESLKDGFLVALVNDQGVLAVHGDEAPGAEASGLDLRALAEAGPDGSWLSAYGVPYLFTSVPLGLGDRPPVRAVLGTPTLSKGVADQVARTQSLSLLALVQAGRVLQAGGVDSAQAQGAEKELKPGSLDVYRRGALEKLGPVQLPAFTQKDALGGGAATQVAARQAISATPYEVIAVADAAPGLIALVHYQRTAIFALALLVGLSLVWTLLMGGGAPADAELDDEDEEAEQEDDREPKGSALESARRAPAPAPRHASEAEDVTRSMPVPPTLPPMPAPEPQREPEPGPDPFAFGSVPEDSPRTDPGMAVPAQVVNKTVPAYAPEPAATPYDEPIPPAAPPPVPDAAQVYDEQPTRAYTLGVPPNGVVQAAQAEDDDFHSTRVATVPDELLRASARPAAELEAEPPRPVAAPLPVFPKVSALPLAAVPAAPNDEAHFQDVYKTFVETREQCGEPGDGLTYEKFAIKLRKNRDQLMQKYNCRSVRFQVYVKEGKAALKATPVRE